MRTNLNDSSTGLVIQDIDYIIRNYIDGTMLMIEEKTRNYWLTSSQEKTYKLMNDIFYLADKNGYVKYKGFFLIVFSNTNFDDGICTVSKPFENDIKVIIPKNGYDYKPRNTLERKGSIKWLKNLLNI